jgi:tetratricopeptide (TPR) repeat protein/DNA-binding MarR family transcriptional regulator
MSATAQRSRFTPSLMPHELLERLFVAREKTLERILACVAASASGLERNHILLVGPRGSGKTHIVSLAYYRVRALQGAGSALQLAWLPEDPWTIVSYQHLLQAIAARLEPPLERPIPGSVPELESLLVHQAEANGPVVVLVENFDQILAGIGNAGQQQLRHMLQAHRPFLLIATTTRLDRELSDQAAPFYGFFTTTRLTPFDVQQAAAMLSVIARESENDRLAAYLHTDQGQARLRAIAHLAGGQPRIWALLASALTIEGLGELVQLLLTQFDDLTPYYQGQLARLSGHQRLIVAALADSDRPISVVELGERLGISQRSLSKTLLELVDRGWVVPTQSILAARLDQRRTYYELAEPLARLSFQIKDSRGEPLRLIVEFLKHWFDPADLRLPTGAPAAKYLLLATTGQNQDPIVAVTRRLNRLPVTRAPTIDLLGEVDDALAALACDEPEPLLRLPTPVRVALETQLTTNGLASARNWVHRSARNEFGDVPHPAMDGWIARAEAWTASSGDEDRVWAQLSIASWLAHAWRFEEAEQAVIALTEMLGAEDGDTLAARVDLGHAYQTAGRLSRAIALLEESLATSERVLGTDAPVAFDARIKLTSAYVSGWRIAQANALLEETIALSDRAFGAESHEALLGRRALAAGYRAEGRVDEAIDLLQESLATSERALGLEHPDSLVLRTALAITYQAAGDSDKAIGLLEETLATSTQALGPEHLDTLSLRTSLASAFRAVGRAEESIELLEPTLATAEEVLGSEHPVTLSLNMELANARQAQGGIEEAIVLLEQTLATAERVLGPEHPETLPFRASLANAYRGAGRAQEALELLEQTLATSEQILGPAHPETLVPRTSLASVYQADGRATEAMALLDENLSISERVLGPGHQVTLELRDTVSRGRDEGDKWRTPGGSTASSDSSTRAPCNRDSHG